MKSKIIVAIGIAFILAVTECLAQDLVPLSYPKKNWQLGVEAFWLANQAESMPTVMLLKRQFSKQRLTQTRYMLGFNYQKNGSPDILLLFFPNNPQFGLNNSSKIDFLVRIGRQKEILTLGKQISILSGVDVEYKYQFSEGLNDAGRDTLRLYLPRKPVFYYTRTNVNRIGLLGVITASYSPSPLLSINIENDLGFYYEHADNYRGRLAAGKYLNLGLWPMSRLYIMFKF